VLGEREIRWVEAAQRGDLESFGRLCEYLYAPTVAIAYAVLADHHLAEDAAQEAFARALRSLRRLRRPARFGTWLARISRNVAVDMARVRPKHGNSEEMGQLACEQDPSDIPRAVQRALGTLPGRARELIVLRYYDNLAYDQISSMLGLSRAAINGRLHRAKKKLAKALEQDGFVET
jgi:RNA polymerase sigma-70 factor (ECF subfamily)